MKLWTSALRKHQRRGLQRLSFENSWKRSGAQRVLVIHLSDLTYGQKHLTSVKYNWLSFWNIKKCCPSLQYVGYKPWAKAMFISSITAEWLEQSALLILLVNSSPIRLIGSWLIPDELTCSDIFDEMIWMNPSVDTKTIWFLCVRSIDYGLPRLSL